MATLARQVMTLRTWLENGNLRTARERVLHHLGLPASGIDCVVRVNGNRKTLASELGLTHERLYRTLAALEAEGAIERAQGWIKLTDRAVPYDHDRTERGGRGGTLVHHFPWSVR